jgi:peptidoglycan/LPS O-acetylase OafA/YrhL
VDSSWDAGIRKVTLLRLDAIGYGVLVAYFEETKRLSKRPSVAKLMCGTGLLLVLVSVFLLALDFDALDSSYPGKTVVLTLCPLGFALSMPFFAGMVSHKKTLLSSAVEHVAKVSYSMYLSNLLIVHLCIWSGVLWKGHPLPNCAIFWAATLTVSSMSYWFIERPFIRLYKRV